MSNPWEKKVGSFRKKYNLALIFHQFTEALGLALIFCGIVVLSVRIFAPQATYLIYGACFFGGIYGIIQTLGAKRHFISTREALAFVDYHSGAQASLITSWERSGDWHRGDWEQDLRDKTFASPRWKLSFFMAKILPPLLFFCATLLVSPRLLPLQAKDKGVEIRQRELERELAKLKKKGLIYRADAKTLEKQLRELKRKKGSSFSQKDWQALDHLQKKIRRAMEKRTEDRKKLERQMASLEKALQNKDLHKVEKAYRELKKTMEGLSKKGKLEKLSSKWKKSLLSSKKNLEKLFRKKTSAKERKRLIEKLSRKLSRRQLARLKKVLSKYKQKKSLSQKELRYIDKLSKQLTQKDLKALKRRLAKLRKKGSLLKKKKKKCPKCGKKGHPGGT